VFAGASRTWLGYQLRDYAYLHARNNAFFTDPAFDTASAQNYKVGANFGGDNWNAGITLFDTRIRGLPNYDGTFLKNDPNEQRSRGVTVNASYRWNDTRIGATFTKARLTSGDATILPNSGTFMPIGDMATLFIDHEIPDYNLKLGATLAWAGSIDAIGTFYEQKAYAVVNAYAEWTPPAFDNMTLRIGVENLFNETYYERSGYATSSARGGIEPVYAPGRTVTFHTALKF
jgi:hemoglobin/transferrin/lactoferrin receptor protein